MFDNVQLVLVGSAATLDTVLLLALANRRNWEYAAYSVFFLAMGGWLWHVGALVMLLAGGLTGPWGAGIGWLARLAMVGGLLLMPSAMWHGVMQLEALSGQRRGTPTASFRQSWAYLPVLGIFPMAVWLVANPSGNFLRLIEPVKGPYLAWLSLVNAIAAWKFFSLRGRVRLPNGRPFFAVTGGTLVFVTALVLLAGGLGPRHWPPLEPYWFLVLLLAPVPLALVFLYFVLRHNLMRLALRRGLLYGAGAVGVWLVYRFATDLAVARLGLSLDFNFHVLEGVLIISLVVANPPLRARTLEALRYLLGSSAQRARERMRELALETSARAGQSPDEVLKWFVASAREALGFDFVAAWLFDEGGAIVARGGEFDRLRDQRVGALYEAMRAAAANHHTLHDAPPEVIEHLDAAKGVLVVRMARDEERGLVLFGRQRASREPDDEQNSALVLLVEQLGVTLRAGRLQAERLAAERRALGQEKLSALGLLAGSIAHEVKNPLSSIKAIATVMAEDLGTESRHARDLELILEEVDRLAASTTQLLRFARPVEARRRAASVGEVVAGTVRMMRHLARERGVIIETAIEDGLPPVRTDENALREILVNLVANSLDAAGVGAGSAARSGGHVWIECHRAGLFVVLEIRDDGPGIAPEIKDSLFEPFVSTKESGTGLGLYVVGRRVRELGGEVRCDVGAGGGTCFQVILPCE